MTKCRSCEKPAEDGKTMCRPHLDAACAKAKAYAANKRAALGLAPRRGGTTAVVKAAPKVTIARPVRTSAPDGGALAAIDEVIAERLADVHTLERAKEILGRD